MTEKELLVAFLSKTLKLDSDGVASLLYDDAGVELKPDALTSLLAKQTDFITTLSKSKKDEGYKAAQREVLGSFEKEIKEKFGNDTALKGIELVADIIQTAEQKAEEKAGIKEVTDDDVKKSKLYQGLQQKLTDAEKDADKKVNDAVAKVQKEYTKKETNAMVDDIALSMLDSRKPVLSTDADKAKRQKRLLIDDIHAEYDFEVEGTGDDRKVKVMTKDGKLAEDKLGHAIDFTALVTTKSDLYYDFEQSDKRTSPPDPNKTAPPAGKKVLPITLKKPTSDKEFSDQYERIEKDTTLKPEERLKLHEENVKLFKGETATS